MPFLSLKDIVYIGRYRICSCAICLVHIHVRLPEQVMENKLVLNFCDNFIITNVHYS